MLYKNKNIRVSSSGDTHLNNNVVSSAKAEEVVAENAPKIFSGLRPLGYELYTYFSLSVDEDCEIYDYMREEHDHVASVMSIGFVNAWKKLASLKKYAHFNLKLHREDFNCDFSDEKSEFKDYDTETPWKFVCELSNSVYPLACPVNADQKEINLLTSSFSVFEKIVDREMKKAIKGDSKIGITPHVIDRSATLKWDGFSYSSDILWYDLGSSGCLGTCDGIYYGDEFSNYTDEEGRMVA